MNYFVWTDWILFYHLLQRWKKTDWICWENGNVVSVIQTHYHLSRLLGKDLLSAYFVPGKGAGIIAAERTDKIS